jgi:toxin FitB
MFLLDTNVVSELRKVGERRGDASVAAWTARHDATRFYISAVTLMEIERGVLLLERRGTDQGVRLRRWLDEQVKATFDTRILPIDAAVATRCAQLHVPTTRPGNDAFIAATALVHEMAVVTRDMTDFEPMGVKLINPWVA